MPSLTLSTHRSVRVGPELVWAVLTDAASWPRWCEPVRHVDRVPAAWVAGERLAFTLGMGPGVPVGFDVTLDEVQPGRRLVWSSQKWWGVRGERSFRIDEVDGASVITDTKVFSSRCWPVDRLYPRGTIRRMSEAWLDGLVAEAERRSA